MRQRCRLVTILCASLAALAASAHAEDWPAFLGPRGNGHSNDRDTPIVWSQTENVAWSTPLPGPGNSSPVVRGGRVFVTAALDGGRERALYCFNRDDGTLLWGRALEFEGVEPTHEANPYCAATPLADERAVYVWYGSAGLVAFDLNGNELWQRDFGPVRHIWGNGSSPILYQDQIILYVGPGEISELHAIDRDTGHTIWRREIPEARNRFTNPSDQAQWYGTWATPVLIDNHGRVEMLFPAPYSLRSYNPLTGAEHWRAGGLGALVYASPAVGDGVVVAVSGYGGPAIAVELPDAGARGDITATHRLWLHERADQRIGTGIVYRDHFYIANDPGIAQCFDLRTGEEVWKERLTTATTWSSMVLASGRLYVTDLNATTHVIAASPTFERLAENELADMDQMTRATPAISEGQVFIRTYDRLWCIGTRLP